MFRQRLILTDIADDAQRRPSSRAVRGHNRITFPVTFCTEHVSRQHASIREMEDIAWILRTDARRRQVGFVQPKDLTPKERYILPDDD
jgi:hypothetical protein